MTLNAVSAPKLGAQPIVNDHTVAPDSPLVNIQFVSDALSVATEEPHLTDFGDQGVLFVPSSVGCADHVGHELGVYDEVITCFRSDEAGLTDLPGFPLARREDSERRVRT